MAEEKGIIGRFLDYLKDTVTERLDIGAAAREALDTVVQKTAQGAAEASQSLNHQADGYVPYGAGQYAVDVQGPQQSYLDMLRDASRGAGQDQEQGIDR